MISRKTIAIGAISGAALLGTGGIAYANVVPTPSDSVSVEAPIVRPTHTPTPTPFGNRPVFCYFQSNNGVQGSFVEFNWDRERRCPRGLLPITLRDILRVAFGTPTPTPFFGSPVR